MSKKSFCINFFFFSEMEFVLRKANYASFNRLLKRNVISIAEKCRE